METYDTHRVREVTYSELVKAFADTPFDVFDGQRIVSYAEMRLTMQQMLERWEDEDELTTERVIGELVASATALADFALSISRATGCCPICGGIDITYDPALRRSRCACGANWKSGRS